MKLLILSVTILLSAVGYSQTDETRTIFKMANTGQIHTVIFNSSNYTSNTIGKLKDDLLAYQEKVTSVIYSETNNTLSITYNEFMSKRDLVDLFNKHKVEHIKNARSNNLDNQ